jgi:hypothetical protein
MQKRPTGTLPTWATDATYTSGVDTGNDTKLEPLSGEKAQGYSRSARPPARKWNWLLNKLGAFVDYLSDVAIQNWEPPAYLDAFGLSIDTNSPTNGGHARPFFDLSRGLWIVPGSDTAGAFYIGNRSSYIHIASGAAFAQKLGCGCYAGTRALLFESPVITSGALGCIRSDVSDTRAGHWARVALPMTVATVGCINDAVAASSGTVVAVGGEDGNLYAYRSTDSGATWTRILVAAASVGDYLARVIEGPSGQLVTWIQSGGTGGDRLYHSEDDGVTWTARTGIGFNAIQDGCYMPDEAVFVFLLNSEVRVVSNVAAGSFVTKTVPSSAVACAALGSILAIVANNGAAAGTSVFYSWDRGDHFNFAEHAGYGASPHSISSGYLGQFCMSGPAYIQTSLRLMAPQRS